MFTILEAGQHERLGWSPYCRPGSIVRETEGSGRARDATSPAMHHTRLRSGTATSAARRRTPARLQTHARWPARCAAQTSRWVLLSAIVTSQATTLPSGGTMRLECGCMRCLARCVRCRPWATTSCPRRASKGSVKPQRRSVKVPVGALLRAPRLSL